MQEEQHTISSVSVQPVSNPLVSVQPVSVQPVSVQPVSNPLVSVQPVSNQPVSNQPVLTIKPLTIGIDDKHVQQMMQNIQLVLKGKPLTPLNLLRVINSVFGAACAIKGLSERLRQTLIINALDNIVDQQTDITPDDKEMLEQMIQTIVPEALDIASDIKNGLISLKKNNSCCTIA